MEGKMKLNLDVTGDVTAKRRNDWRELPAKELGNLLMLIPPDREEDQRYP